MKTMKRSLFLFCLAAALAGAADLGSVHRVYLLPMAHGMDQYIANQLTNGHVFEVVTDPKLADALLTDHLGRGFEAQYDEIFPPPVEPKPAKADPEPKAKGGGDDRGVIDMFTNTENKVASPSAASSFGRTKGTVFLVETKSRQVVWSTYAPPKTLSGHELNHTASEIVGRIKKDLNPNPKK